MVRILGAEKDAAAEKLHGEVEKALAEPIVQQRIAAAAGEPFNLPLAEITPFVQAEIAKWADVVKRGAILRQEASTSILAARRPSARESPPVPCAHGHL